MILIGTGFKIIHFAQWRPKISATASYGGHTQNGLCAQSHRLLRIAVQQSVPVRVPCQYLSGDTVPLRGFYFIAKLQKVFVV